MRFQVFQEVGEKYGLAIAETCADIGPTAAFDAKIERVDFPKKLPEYQWLAYCRKEM